MYSLARELLRRCNISWDLSYAKLCEIMTLHGLKLEYYSSSKCLLSLFLSLSLLDLCFLWSNRLHAGKILNIDEKEPVMLFFRGHAGHE